MKYKIAELCEINRKNISKKDDIEYINYLDTSNLIEGVIKELKKFNIKTDKVPSRAKRLVKENDILISTVRPNQKHYGIIRELPENLVVSTGFAVLTPDQQKVYPEYLYRFLTQNHITEYLQSIAETSTSAYPSIKPSVIGDLEIDLPPLKVQKSIADIFLIIDKKIMINNKINNIIEELAKAIYEHWFIDFEFPNENGEPYYSNGGELVESEVGLIPKSWRVIKLEEIANIYSGYSYKGRELTESEDAMITIKNFDTNGNFKLDGYKEISLSERVKEHHFAKEFDIIVAHTDLTQKAEIIGNPILIFTKNRYKRLIYSMDTVKVVPKKEIYRFFIFNQLKNSRFKNFALSYSSGTTVLHLSKKALPNFKIAMPHCDEIIHEFDKIVRKIYEMIKNNYEMNQKLEEIRNLILPKLMSGEIRVPVESD